MSDDSERQEVEAFRAQMLRQMLGGQAPSTEPNAVDELLGKSSSAAPEDAEPKVVQASTLAAGQVLVANPERFCSRNPFSRPVRDLSRFGLSGPIDDDELSPDMKAQMLPVRARRRRRHCRAASERAQPPPLVLSPPRVLPPTARPSARVHAPVRQVLLLIEHSKGGSRALLMERRTGALMGDVSMDEYGCVAISPLWLGGTAKQNSLYVVHNVGGFEGASEVSAGLYLGGWSEARPKVADSSIADTRFKFFLGATEWGAGQLEDELKAGAWVALECDPTVVIKDRVMGWRPGKPKPVWTELMNGLDSEEARRIVSQIYPAKRSD